MINNYIFPIKNPKLHILRKILFLSNYDEDWITTFILNKNENLIQYQINEFGEPKKCNI